MLTGPSRLLVPQGWGVEPVNITVVVSSVGEERDEGVGCLVAGWWSLIDRGDAFQEVSRFSSRSAWR